MITVSGLILDLDKAQILKEARALAKILEIKKSVEIYITVSLYGIDNGICSQLGPNRYQIWLNKALGSGYKRRVLAHEFFHISQFCEKRLEIRNNLLYFEGICMTSVPYLRRPYEIEAFSFAKTF